MDQSPDAGALLTGAPRHLRRRHLQREIPDTLLVPGAQPVVAAPPRTGGLVPSFSAKSRSSGAAARSYRRKRLVALALMVLLAATSIFCLVLVLMLDGPTPP